MWSLEKNKYDVASLCVNESLFALGNGQLGVRACFEEQVLPSIRGTYINGFYDIMDVQYGEKLYGFPEETERQVNVIETQTMLVTLDGEALELSHEVVNDFHQALDFKKGYSLRSYTYTTRSGKKAKFVFRRLVSFVESALFLMHMSVVYDGEIVIKSYVDGNVTTYCDEDDPRVGSHKERLLRVEAIEVSDDEVVHIKALTKRSNLELNVHSKLMEWASVRSEGIVHEIDEATVTSTMIGRGQLSISKYNVYTSGPIGSNSEGKGAEILEKVIKKDFEDHLKDQSAYMQKVWSDADIVIKGDDRAQQAVRFNLFQLFQSAGRDGHTNISAKGLTGEGYEGHIFWDTEIYILPVILMSQPKLAKSLLKYRHSLLSASRERAKILGHNQGVKFPWRTIKGRECSTFFPAGTAQYHINGDIAYSFIQYYWASHDLDFMLSHGFEVLLETSRLWLDMGHFYEDSFRIDAVTGPDEYSCVVNNNFYTNSLAKYGLKWTVHFNSMLKCEYPEAYQDLSRRLQVTTEEIALFKKASELMLLPYDQNLNIHLQDDHFMYKKKWDFKGTPEDNYPLLLHYHPLTIYRHQVLKQADTVLAHFLLEEEMPEDVVRSSYHYYEGITTHDSSLSSCIYGIMAAKLGEKEKAWRLIENSLYLDLEDLHRNTKDGLHMANLAGSVMAILYGFMGYRHSDLGIQIAPHMPDKWSEVHFKIRHDEGYLDVMVSDSIRVCNNSKIPVALTVYKEVHQIQDSVTLQLQE